MTDKTTDKMGRLPQAAQIDWREGEIPLARQFDDVYFSFSGGLKETEQNFLRGCDLPEAWAGREHFTIGELGFGTGLNLLAVWKLWQENRPSPQAILHFSSFEGFPMERAAAARALAAIPEISIQAAQLLDKWPLAVRGVQQIFWKDAGIALTLHIGDIAATLPESQLKADAWFLDGFSPAKNPDMWAEWIYPALAARAHTGAPVGTFTVAGKVRRGLSDAGFEVSKQPGFGHKRQRLQARLVEDSKPSPDTHGLRPPETQPQTIAIIGTGIAGACLAHRLKEFGANITVFDQASDTAMAASGNPLALVMPRLDAGDTAEARVSLSAYVQALSAYAGLPGVTAVTTRQSPRHPSDGRKFTALAANPPLPASHLNATPEYIDHKNSLIIQPHTLIPHLLQGIEMRLGADVVIDYTTKIVNGQQFDAIILANSMGAAMVVPWVGLEPRLGQVNFVESNRPVEPSANVNGGYAIRAGTTHLWGATFGAGTGETQSDFTPAPRQQASVANWQNLLDMTLTEWEKSELTESAGRAAWRATARDYLPVIGGVPDFDAALLAFDGVKHGQKAKSDIPLMNGIYTVTGLGARGFTFAPWGANLLAAQLFNTPCNCEILCAKAVSPARFIHRGLKRGAF